MKPHSLSQNKRARIHYWKCDRAAAFHGTQTSSPRPDMKELLLGVLQNLFPDKSVVLDAGGGQGNHITYNAHIGGREYFLRVEDGPEGDDYMEAESLVLRLVKSAGIPAPGVIFFDARRKLIPVAWQLLELIPYPDLNSLLKAGTLNLPRVARKIGQYVARWQGIETINFGPFDIESCQKGALCGLHSDYPTYFYINLDAHLKFLTDGEFISAHRAEEIQNVIDSHRSLLELDHGCLVHKDLALWNILGTTDNITSVIDWDDAISGDPLDDISLIACFHDGETVQQVLDGYASARPLPPDYLARFWLHLLRNMLVKAVIRLGSGYFDKSDSLFLIGTGMSGANLRQVTKEKIDAAMLGLAGRFKIESL